MSTPRLNSCATLTSGVELLAMHAGGDPAESMDIDAMIAASRLQ